MAEYVAGSRREVEASSCSAVEPTPLLVLTPFGAGWNAGNAADEAEVAVAAAAADEEEEDGGKAVPADMLQR
jgi:hypothetical protein